MGNAFTGPLLVALLLITGLYFSFYLGWPQIRYFRAAFRILIGKSGTQTQQGDTSPLQAIATSLGGSVGTGSIAGVALAIHLGGPSSLFWMLVTALLGMTTKFVEVTLCHRYREQTADGSMAGGPMYYMDKQLKMPWLGKFFAIVTLFAAFAAGTLPQTNSIANAMYYSFGISEWLTAVVSSLCLGIIVVGGIRRIGQVAERLMPLMALIYFVGVLAVVLHYSDRVLPAFLSIFSDVMSGTAAVGGFLGTSVVMALHQGIHRGFYSNEAGAGAAGITHASSQLDDSVEAGLLALLEPFISTMIICMLTGVAILAGGAWTERIDHKLEHVDIVVLQGEYDAARAEEGAQLSAHFQGRACLPKFTGDLVVQEGRIQHPGITFTHARSVAAEVRIYQGQELFTGTIPIYAGHVGLRASKLTFWGKSLLAGIDLVAHTFVASWLGKLGAYVLSISLLLFAFTTIIAWYYYGDRCLVYLGGARYLGIYRLVFVIMASTGALMDTTIVWNFSGITFALMAVPNLIGMLLMRREMKHLLRTYQGLQKR